MADGIHTLRCPCCGKRLEFDAKTGKARALTVAENDDLDRLVAKQKREAERLDAVFDDARASQAKESERFDELFRKASDEARTDPDRDKPRNPFDLD